MLGVSNLLKRPYKPSILLYAVLSATPFNQCAFANDNSVNQSESRLSKERLLDLPNVSISQPKSLQEAIDAQKKQTKAQKLLKIDIKKSIEQFDHPDTHEASQKLLGVHGHELTIDQVRQQALENNLSIKVAQVDPTIANTLVRQEEAKFDKVIFAYAKYNNVDLPKYSNDNVSLKSTDAGLNNQAVKLDTLAQDTNKLDFEAGIKIPLRTGGTVTLSSPLSRKKTDGNFDSLEYRSALKFSFSQPLLRNAGRDANEASIRIASIGQQDAKLKTRLQTIRVLAMIDKAYWALYQAWGVLEVRRLQHEYATQNLMMVKRRVQEGLTARVEINRSEIGVADRMEGLIIAQTNVKLAQRQLQFLLNDISDEDNPDYYMVPSTDPTLVKYDFDRKKLFNDALDSRIELLQQELKLTADLQKIGYLENQTLPLFSLDYQYGALSNTQSRFNNSYDHVLNGQFSDWSVGLKFEMPLTNEARKSRLDRAVQTRMQRLTTKRLQTLTVKREIYDALDKVDQNWQRILFARQQVLIAGINYEAELKQFNEGIRTMTEVLETLTRLGDAQIKEIKSISDYQVALVDTAYATGTLLGYGNFELQ